MTRTKRKTTETNTLVMSNRIKNIIMTALQCPEVLSDEQFKWTGSEHNKVLRMRGTCPLRKPSLVPLHLPQRDYSKEPNCPTIVSLFALKPDVTTCIQSQNMQGSSGIAAWFADATEVKDILCFECRTFFVLSLSVGANLVLQIRAVVGWASESEGDKRWRGADASQVRVKWGQT